MIFAQHPALRSIAAISVVGILCVVLMAQVFILVVFFADYQQNEEGVISLDGNVFFKTVFSQVWFIGGSMILAGIGFLLVRCNPFNKEKGNTLSYCYCYFSKSLIYIMSNVKKTIFNPHGENFKKPAVLICNHQSGLDNFVMMMMHPAIIVLTNDKVRSAPVSGAVVRMADYYSVSDGAEKSMEK